MTAHTPTRLFVYGSCVSRDTVETMDRGDVHLVAYIARQSLVSALGPPAPAHLAPAGLSRFQRRMVEGDLRSDLPDRVQQHGTEVDLLVWDLTDERLGVYALPDGSFVTRSAEIVGSELERRVREEGELVEFGTDRHFDLWREAAGRWLALLRRFHLTERTVVLAPPWATHLSDGGPVPSSFGLEPATANELYERYLDVLRAEGLPVARTDEATTLASADHRWGAAPFHYDDATYASLVAHIESRARALPGRAEPLGPGHPHAEPDFARWSAWGPPHTWPSVQAFGAARDLPDGVHRVRTPGGTLDLLLTGRPFARDNPWHSVPVFFTGALTQRAGSPGPHLSGLRVSQELGLPAVLVADTALTQHGDLNVAWYAGCESAPSQRFLMDLVRTMHRASARPLLLVGGSSGGFAALALAAAVGPDVSVFCWNPQTDLLAYIAPAVTAYLRSCFPSVPALDPAVPDQREELRGLLAARGVRTLAWPGATTRTRVLYVQNIGDWHVPTHLAPFAEHLGLPDDGLVRESGATRVLLGAWGTGHAIPPAAMLSLGIAAMARGASAADASRELETAFPGTFSSAAATRFMAEPVFSATRDGAGAVTVTAQVPPGATAWLTFAYYLQAGTERLSTRWYDADPTHVVTGADAATVTSVQCFARDPWGQQVVRTVPVTDPAPAGSG